MTPSTRRRILDAARAIGRRHTHGEPTKNWNEAEVALATLILVYGDPGKLGGTRRTASGESRQHPAVTAAAQAIGRTEDAVVMKVMNLRQVLTGGGRGMAHGAKLDRWAIETFAQHLDDLHLAAALVGALVPGSEDVARHLVRLPDAVQEQDDVLTNIDLDLDGDEQETTALREVLVRRGQGQFRSRVLANFEHSCAFCGLRSRVPDRNAYLLIASHIRPWAASNGHARLDPANGLSLCALHDRAFEWGFLGLDQDLKVVVSAGAREHYEPEERVKAEIEDLHGQPLGRRERHFVEPGTSYLEFHRDEVFDRRFRVAG